MWTILLLLFSLSNAKVFSPTFDTNLRNFVDTSMKCHQIPGMGLAIVKGDEIWTGGFGSENILSGKIVDANTKFNIGSLTKAFTATLLGTLLSERGLNWSTKVADILGPEYEFTDDYRTKELTLRDLLSHRTGLAGLYFGSVCGIPRTLSRSSFCKSLKHLPEEIPVRDGFLYNNYMYILLGHVTEILGGDFWENLMKTRILHPIGMENTSFILLPSDVFGSNVARPYIYKNGVFENGTLELYDLHPIGSDGGILSSAADMAKWMKFNLQMGKTESGRQLLDKTMMGEMRKVTTTIIGRPDLTMPNYPVHDITRGYGYAWFISEYRGYSMVRHSGSMFSYVTELWLFPDRGIGIFGSVNGPGVSRSAADHLSVSLYYIADQLLGLNPWLNASTACSFPEPWDNRTVSAVKSKEIPIHVDNFTDYEGTYGNQMFADITVFENSSVLFLDSNHVHGVLHPSSEKDRFLFEVTTPWEFAANVSKVQAMNVTFARDYINGTVNSLKLKLEVDLTYTKGISVLDLK